MKINGTNLSMIRGDSESITVTVKDNTGAQVNLITGDIVYLTVKLNEATENKILQKEVTSFVEGKAIIEILPEDTTALRYGAYKYDIQWISHDGKVTTLVAPSIFKVEPEITFETVAI